MLATQGLGCSGGHHWAKDAFKNLQFFSSKWDHFLQAAFALTWKYGGTGKTTENFEMQQLENISSLKCYCKCLHGL